MLVSNPAIDSVAIVLYQPQDVVNVAAIIRVMSNFGLTQLRLVEPAAFDPYRIEGIAHHTRELIEATRRFASLEEALSDCGLVLGTTGRPRQGERLILTPRQAAPYTLEAARHQRVAILFGPEQDGLPNEALDRCHGLITIPTHPRNPSLNLAQAALVIAYELWMSAAAPREGAPPAPAPPPAALAGGSERESLFGALEQLLRSLYPATTPDRLEGAMARLRTLLMRAQPRREEAEALTNLLRHAARAARREE
ncbi:MAG: RNA methyltransferase [Pseudomonadota bacterium]